MLNRGKKIYNKVEEILFLDRSAFFIFLFFIFALFSRGFPALAKGYYFVPILLFTYLFFGINQIRGNGDLKKIIILIIIFASWASLTSFWSIYPIFTLKRSLYFLVISSGSLLVGFNLAKQNQSFLLKSSLFFNILLVVASVFSALLNIPENAWSGGHGLGLLGFTNHQNKLGQFVYLSVIPVFIFLKQSKNKKVQIFLFLLVFINLIIISLSVSRGAILALFFFILIYFLINFSFRKTLLMCVVFILIISSTIHISANYFGKEQITIIKNEKMFGERRYQTIQDSWDSALNGCIFGLGYGISDERFKNLMLGYIDKTNEGEIYRREKTISVLALIEEVGMIGLILFLLVLGYPIKLIWIRIKNTVNQSTNHENNKKDCHSGLDPESIRSGHSELRTERSRSIISESKKDHVIPERFYRESSFLIFTFAFLISLNIYAQIESWWIGIGSAVMPIYFLFVGSALRDLKS